MAEIHDTASCIRQNLLDAGCDRKTVEACMASYLEGHRGLVLSALAKHRTKLLDLLHREQKRIDCLDYLIYTLRREEREEIKGLDRNEKHDWY